MPKRRLCPAAGRTNWTPSTARGAPSSVISKSLAVSVSTAWPRASDTMASRRTRCSRTAAGPVAANTATNRRVRLKPDTTKAVAPAFRRAVVAPNMLPGHAEADQLLGLRAVGGACLDLDEIFADCQPRERQLNLLRARNRGRDD